MYFPDQLRKTPLFLSAFLLTFAALVLLNHWNVFAAPEPNDLTGTRLNLTPDAKEALQDGDLAFPSDSAGFSAYYRMMDDGNARLDKSKVDGHIFSPVEDGSTDVLLKQADMVDIGDNYTIATLSLENVDAIPSEVNLYYDSEGWIVAYLPSGTPSSEVWQARGLDIENPKIEDISNTTLLDAINVVVKDALEETIIDTQNEKLGYYHWQHQEADNFLMMAISRDVVGEYPVQFSVPNTLTIQEVAGTLWISKGESAEAPCARVTLDDSDLISDKCTKGIFSMTRDLENFNARMGHSWKLEQTLRDEGASGALLMILYSVSN